MPPSQALDQFMQIFFHLCIAAVPLIVPLLVITWAVRITAELLRGGR